MSGYDDALRAAGAEVLAFEQFGSYQGDWLAKVRFDGQEFWIRDYYGSCSHCDALEADVGWEPYGEDAGELLEYSKKLKDFGLGLLEPQERLTYEQAVLKASENIAWDSGAEEMLLWLKKHGEPA